LEKKGNGPCARCTRARVCYSGRRETGERRAHGRSRDPRGGGAATRRRTAGVVDLDLTRGPGDDGCQPGGLHPPSVPSIRRRSRRASLRRPTPPLTSEPNHFTSGSRQEQPSPPTSGPVLSATRLLAVPRCVRQKQQQQQQVQPSPSPLSATAPPRAGSREGRRRRRARRRDESLRAWAVSARDLDRIVHMLLRSAPFAFFTPLVPGLAPVGSGRRDPGRCCWN